MKIDIWSSILQICQNAPRRQIFWTSNWDIQIYELLNGINWTQITQCRMEMDFHRIFIYSLKILVKEKGRNQFFFFKLIELPLMNRFFISSINADPIVSSQWINSPKTPILVSTSLISIMKIMTNQLLTSNKNGFLTADELLFCIVLFVSHSQSVPLSILKVAMNFLCKYWHHSSTLFKLSYTHCSTATH